MSKKSKSQTAQTKPKSTEQTPLNAPWISMRVGVIIIAIASIVMAVLTAIQTIPVKGVFEGIMWGVLFGGLIWIIFLGNILINRFLRRRS